VHTGAPGCMLACVRACFACVRAVCTCVRAHVRLPACRPDQQTDQLKQSGPGMCQRTCVQTVRVRGCMHACMRGCMRPSVRPCVRACVYAVCIAIRAYVRMSAYLPAGQMPTCLPAGSANGPTEAVGSWNVSANMCANSTRAWVYACVRAWVHASIRACVLACVRCM
jgi:hypothetical protein